MNAEQFQDKLTQLDACNEACIWAKGKDLETVWATCQRGDWMLWLARKCNVDKRKLTLAKGLCAETVKHLMKDPRSIAAVEAAIKYGNREIDDTELRNTADTTHAAADTASIEDSIAAIAADTASIDSYQTAALAAIIVAHNAYDTADNVASAYAAYTAARKKSELQTAEIVRNTISIKDLNLNLL